MRISAVSRITVAATHRLSANGNQILSGMNMKTLLISLIILLALSISSCAGTKPEHNDMEKERDIDQSTVDTSVLISFEEQAPLSDEEIRSTIDKNIDILIKNGGKHISEESLLTFFCKFP